MKQLPYGTLALVLLLLGMSRVPELKAAGLWSSPLVHVDPFHLLSNCFWIALPGGLIERRKGVRTLLILVALGFVLPSLGSILFWRMVGEPSLSLGASGVAITLLGYGLYTQRGFWQILCAVGALSLIGWGIWTEGDHAAHGVGLALGLFCAKCGV